MPKLIWPALLGVFVLVALSGILRADYPYPTIFGIPVAGNCIKAGAGPAPGQLADAGGTCVVAVGNAVAGAYNFTSPLISYGNSAGAPTHLATQQATPPALTSCGTSPAITGTDEAGIVTMGTATPVGCVVTFNVAYTGTPFCVVTWIATPLASQSYVTSNAAITLTQTATSSNKVQYICRAPAGG